MIVIALALAGAPVAAAAAPAPTVLALSLADVERAALAASPAVKAADEDLAAAAAGASGSFGALWPKLSLEGSYRYVGEIPSLAIIPKAPPFPFGTHDNYSVGPQVAWNLDALGTYESWKSAAAARQARREALTAQRAGVRLEARSLYLGAWLASEQVRLLGGSLALSVSQAGDIHLRQGAGASSRADDLLATNEALNRRMQFRQARADLAGALRDLFALTGLGGGADPALPLPDGMAAPADAAPPTLTVRLDPVTDLLAALGPASASPYNPDPARVRALAASAEAARRLATGLSAGHWPRLSVAAKRSVDYPNGPLPEQVWQNTVTVAASFPLFSFGQVSGSVATQAATARAAERRTDQARVDAERDWRKALDQIAALTEARPLNAQVVASATEVARLTFLSYEAGSASYLEVQSANLGALSAGVAAARTDVTLLLELAMAASLNE